MAQKKPEINKADELKIFYKKLIILDFEPLDKLIDEENEVKWVFKQKVDQ